MSKSPTSAMAWAPTLRRDPGIDDAGRQMRLDERHVQAADEEPGDEQAIAAMPHGRLERLPQRLRRGSGAPPLWSSKGRPRGTPAGTSRPTRTSAVIQP